MAGLSCGIVGLPNVGKSTLFNAITAARAPASNYPFCTIDPNVGVVEVFDPRLKVLADISKSARIVYATTELVDIAGLVKGASKGEGLGNAFLSHIRQVDAIIHVVRGFESGDIVHVMGRVDPIEDIGIINLELILADLASAENSLGKLERQVKAKKELQPTFDVLVKVRDHLNRNLPVRALALSPEERELLLPYPFITAKKVLYAVNVSEIELPSMDNAHVQAVCAFAAAEGSAVIPISARIEEEIAELPSEERQPFMETLGLKESGLQRLVKASFDLLELITFLTTGEMETRAWTITRGTTAKEAAGKIHSDIERGFIRAEVIAFEDFARYGSRAAAKEAGRARMEGKEYIVQDGDVILFHHSH